MRGSIGDFSRFDISPLLLPSPHLLPFSAPSPNTGDCIMPDPRSIGDGRRRQSTLIKQACDACKLRKVKCIYNDSLQTTNAASNSCQRCLRLAIECTFSLPQKCRGPRKRRDNVGCVVKYYFDTETFELKTTKQEQHCHSIIGTNIDRRFIDSNIPKIIAKWILAPA